MRIIEHVGRSRALFRVARPSYDPKKEEAQMNRWSKDSLARASRLGLRKFEGPYATMNKITIKSEEA